MRIKLLLQNLTLAPIVLIIRTPIILILLFFMWIGNLAEEAFYYCNEKLPAFKRYEG